MLVPDTVVGTCLLPADMNCLVSFGKVSVC